MKTVANRAILLGTLVLACWVQVGAQRSGNTTLVVRVSPEAHVVPSQVSLRFRTSADGVGDITSQTQVIAAWVRAIPGQHIRLTARLAAFSGPAGAGSTPTIRWSGTSVHSTGGGQTATCTNGTLPAGAALDLVAGWQRSGTLTCAIAFGLADPQSLPAGTYTGTIDLDLRSE
jgi:hypothetical protein